jgi:hypothetical protein
VTTFTTPEQIEYFRAIILKTYLKFYLKTKMLPTSKTTITKMMEEVSKFTGIKYKRGEAEKAYSDLKSWLDTKMEVKND